MQLLSGKKKRGFTLTELLTTIALIGLLSTLMAPRFHRAFRCAKDRMCLAQQKNGYVALHTLYDDIIKDFTIKESENYDDLSKVLITEYVHPLSKDNEFGEMNVYTSQPLTCPYSSGNGRSRAPFRVVPMSNFPEERQLPQFRGVNYITYNYGLEIEHLNLNRDGNKEIAVTDMLNFGFYQSALVREWFSGMSRLNGAEYYANRFVHFDPSFLHPHKGKGMYATFGSGEQRWVSYKELVQSAEKIEKKDE